ncbi:MAG: Eco57I restriction-modification methylase domain-containing protein [Limnospira sp.]
MANLSGLQIEGNLIVSDLTSDLLAGDIKGQAAEDFGLGKSDKLADEIAIAWGDAKAYWAAFRRAFSRLPEGDAATTATREQWVVPLLRSLGYDPVYVAKAEVVEGLTYAISHRAELGTDKPPVHIVGAGVRLEERPPSGTPRLSAHALVQEYLNRTEHLWAVVTNGLRWRLLRDSSLMTRLSYIEFDLEQILDGENFAEFGLFYRLFHRSRLPRDADDADRCLLEFYHQESLQQGGRVRDRLRDGVERALVLLGTGFLQHENSRKLRDRVEGGDLDGETFYRQLLRLIYRLLFLMVAESRGALLAGSDAEKARIYTEYYSIERLRAIAEKPSYRREGYQDLWQGLRVTFALFDENWRGRLLDLSPLNGDLFGSESLAELDGYAIDNHDLKTAIRHLSLYENKGQWRRVNYGALDVEELGSVYESLLDFNPKIECKSGIYYFRLVTGSDRKTTGSYYTPPALVGQLIESALEPVIAQRLQEIENHQTSPTPHSPLPTPSREEVLLSLKICDPACGSGHFLLAAARRLGKELARVRTGEAQPGPEPLRQAIRDVIQHCIYGVDLNPLAVDLCKVALWIEGFCRGLPLNFLDHRIKCGNSIVGVLDVDCLDEGIPDAAFKAMAGDDKKVVASFKKRNKQELKDMATGQLSLVFEDPKSAGRQEYAKGFQALGESPETTTDEVKRKAEEYQLLHSPENLKWWRDRTACNLWTAAFFTPLTLQNLQLIPTSATLHRVLEGATAEELTREGTALFAIIDAANRVADSYRFFHWAIEFPDVFENGGFDCVLGNPPWEQLQIAEKEFFAGKDDTIVSAKTSVARKKLIAKLPQENPQLAKAWADAKYFADAQNKFIRESRRFPLTATGKINTYAVFSETARNLISDSGYAGIIVPTGIATDATCQHFFGDLVKKKSLKTLFDFENRHGIFSAVHRNYKFALIVIGKSNIKTTDFSFFLLEPNQVNDLSRKFELQPEDIQLMNPNTLTCPIFRTRTDAELTKKIYRRVPVLENEQTGENPWGISFMRMFDMSNDSGLFYNEPESDRLPLYEGKMFWQFDHRHGTYKGEKIENSPIEDKQNPDYSVTPRYWVDRTEVENKLGDRWDKEWLLGFRDVCRSTDERTAIFSLLPKVAVGHKGPLLFVSENHVNKFSCLLANLNSLVFDFVTRQKLGGTSFSYFILKQLPIIPPDWYTPEDIEYISSRVLELVYTSHDMKPFAADMGYSGEPFIWDENRRAILKAELDAKYARLYGLTRDELRYILDPADIHGDDFPSETFRVLKNNEMKAYGEYRTRRLVLEAWDRLG